MEMTTKKKSHRTAGVGSVVVSVQDTASHDRIKALMRVGQKRRLSTKDDDDDDDDDDGMKPPQVSKIKDDDDDDDEEENGRTGINDNKRGRILDHVVESGISSKKKKKGKKERQQDITTGSATPSLLERPCTIDSEVRSTSNDDNNKQTDIDATIIGSDHNTVTTTTKRKHHRPKVRSRQKNIYKDKRTTDQKPSHLILGTRDFQGRPMTAETRTKLDLEPSNNNNASSNRRPRHYDNFTRNEHNQEQSMEHDDDLENKSRTHGARAGGTNDHDGGLAIDDWLADDVADSTFQADHVAAAATPIKRHGQHSKSQSKRRPKYKNLVV